MTTAPYAEVLRLARAGNPGRAWSLFCATGLDRNVVDPGVLTLKGRLLKNQADRAEDATTADRLLRKAVDAYLAAHKLTPDSYPLINAATLSFLAGEQEQSRTYAKQTLSLIDGNPQEGETPFWRNATRAEALLLLGQEQEAKTALSDGIEKLPQAWEDHAATLSQFERILEAQGADAGWLDAYRPPCAVHFSGMIGLDHNSEELHAQIRRTLDHLKPGFAYGALAAGADIMLAEALVRRGAQLHITLPLELAEFRQVSVLPFGEEWVERFDALLERVEAIEVIPSALNREERSFGSSIELASLASMGRCLRHADTLRTHAHAVTVADPTETDRPHVRYWQDSAHPLHIIHAKRSSNKRSKLEGRSPDIRGLVLPSDPTQRSISAPAVEALDAALERVGAASEAAGLAIVISSSIGLDDQCAEVAQLQDLAKAVGPGVIYADLQTALIARVFRSDLHVEELGELATQSGQVSLWSISER